VTVAVRDHAALALAAALIFLGRLGRLLENVRRLHRHACGVVQRRQEEKQLTH
jgi:hypothetical protein